jgi:hypothetical protein
LAAGRDSAGARGADGAAPAAGDITVRITGWGGAGGAGREAWVVVSAKNSARCSRKLTKPART